MKKIMLTFMALAFAAVAVSAQSLVENSFYTKSVQLEAEAKAAFDEGEYDLAADLAAQAVENARLSDEYVAMILSMRTADLAINSAQARYDWATGVRADVRMPTAYAGATAELAAARASYTAEAYDEATVHAETVEAYLADVTDEEILPAFYIVQERSTMTDCLWRIAGMPYIYGDPFKWPVLYRANKAALPDANNPDLILPGTKIAIPSIQGELREGLWTEGLMYPTFTATK